jgi:hypothetical protein
VGVLGLKAKLLYSIGAKAAALEAIGEMLVEGRRLLRAEETLSEPIVAENFEAMALILHREGRLNEAHKTMSQAVDLWRRRAGTHPEVETKELARCLRAQAAVTIPPRKSGLSEIAREINRLGAQVKGSCDVD